MSHEFRAFVLCKAFSNSGSHPYFLHLAVSPTPIEDEFGVKNIRSSSQGFLVSELVELVQVCCSQ